MFLGHLALGFAAKRVAPKASLGVLLGASEFIDLLFPAFVIAGWEAVKIVPSGNPFLATEFHYPLSHSLAMTLVWSVGAASVYWLAMRYRKGSAAVGLLVLSHWLLDLVSHRPDLPLIPGPSPMVGLGLWYSVAGTGIVELGRFGAGVWLYLTGTRARDSIGRYGIWAFVGVFLAIYASLAAGPPPPDAGAFAWVGVSFVLFLAAAWWIDRHREVRQAHAH
jgi:hypothetical protein